MDFSNIKLLTKQKRYGDALTECGKLLRELPDKNVEILRVRAYVFAMAGDYVRAVEDRETIFGLGEGTIRDYFRAAEHGLSAGQFIKASTWLSEVLRLGAEQNETWFNSSSYFLLAYAKMELGKYKEAVMNLDHAISHEANVVMPLPGMRGMCSDQQLREEIRRRASKSEPV